LSNRLDGGSETPSAARTGDAAVPNARNYCVIPAIQISPLPS
jgi:hypothetical protein